MIEVVDFKAKHMRELFLQQPPHLAFLEDIITDEHLAAHEKCGMTFTCIDKETKRVLLCGGVALYHPNRGEAWTVFAANVTKELLLLHRAVRTFLEECPVERIESAIYWDAGEKTARRWIESLGFELEVSRMRKFAPNGCDASLYVRIK
jgi:hypothetical protein